MIRRPESTFGIASGQPLALGGLTFWVAPRLEFWIGRDRRPIVIDSVDDRPGSIRTVGHAQGASSALAVTIEWTSAGDALDLLVTVDTGSQPEPEGAAWWRTELMLSMPMARPAVVWCGSPSGDPQAPPARMARQLTRDGVADGHGDPACGAAHANWLELRDQAQHGLRVEAGTPMGFSAQARTGGDVALTLDAVRLGSARPTDLAIAARFSALPPAFAHAR